MLNTISNQKSELINISSYKLTKLWLEAVENININGTTSQVMTALIYHYNPEHEYVFPHQETIARRIKRSVATVKRAISELQTLKFIEIKRTRSGNLYKFTPVFFVTVKAKTCTVLAGKNELSMEHDKLTNKTTDKKEKVKKSEAKKIVKVVFSPISSKIPEFKPSEIPAIIAKNPKIKNPKAYWNSLSPQVQNEYHLKDKQAKELEAKRKEQEAERQRQSYENYLKAEQAKTAKPLHQSYTKEEAINYIKTYNRNNFMRIFARKSPIIQALCKRFSFNLDELLNV